MPSSDHTLLINGWGSCLFICLCHPRNLLNLYALVVVNRLFCCVAFVFQSSSRLREEFRKCRRARCMHSNNNNRPYCRIISIVPCSVGQSALLRCLFYFSIFLFIVAVIDSIVRSTFSWMTKPFFFQSWHSKVMQFAWQIISAL